MSDTEHREEIADMIEVEIEGAVSAIDAGHLATATRRADAALRYLKVLREACGLGPLRAERLRAELLDKIT